MKNTTNENGEASEASQLKENLMKSVDVARSRLGRYLIRLVQISRFMFSVTRWDVAEAFNHVRMNKWVFPLVLFRPRAILFICFGATQHLIETKRPLKRDCGARFKKKISNSSNVNIFRARLNDPAAFLLPSVCHWISLLFFRSFATNSSVPKCFKRLLEINIL